jgi:hypothetical protein
MGDYDMGSWDVGIDYQPQYDWSQYAFDPYAGYGYDTGEAAPIDWSQYMNQPTDTSSMENYIGDYTGGGGTPIPGYVSTQGIGGGGGVYGAADAAGGGIGQYANLATTIAGILAKLKGGTGTKSTGTNQAAGAIQYPPQKAAGLQGAQQAISNLRIPGVNQVDLASLLGLGQKNLTTMQQQVIDPTTYLAQHGAQFVDPTQYQNMVNMANKMYGPDYLRQQIAPLMSNAGITGGADLSRVVDQSSNINQMRNQAIMTALQNQAGATTQQNILNQSAKTGAMGALPGFLGQQAGLVSDPYSQALNMSTAGGQMTLADFLALANASSPTGSTQAGTQTQAYGQQNLLQQLGQLLSSTGAAGSVQQQGQWNPVTGQYQYPPQQQQTSVISSLLSALGLGG